MAGRFKIISLNVRGLRNLVKRRPIFSYLKNQKANLYYLQETIFQRRRREDMVCIIGGRGQMLFSQGSEHSRGVCMFLNVNSGFSITVVHANQDGRFIIAKISINDEQIFVVNIYAPNNYAQQELFIRNLGANLISITGIRKQLLQAIGMTPCSLKTNVAAFLGKKQAIVAPLLTSWKN